MKALSKIPLYTLCSCPRLTITKGPYSIRPYIYPAGHFRKALLIDSKTLGSLCFGIYCGALRNAEQQRCQACDHNLFRVKLRLPNRLCWRVSGTVRSVRGTTPRIGVTPPSRFDFASYLFAPLIVPPGGLCTSRDWRAPIYGPYHTLISKQRTHYWRCSAL